MNKLSTVIRLSLVGAASVAVLGGLAAPAHAATTTTAEKSGNTLLVTGAFSTANSITVSTGAGFIRVNDIGNVTALTGCLPDGQRQVRCSTAGISEIRVSTGARDDRILLNTGFFTTVLAGNDNDFVQNIGSGQARLNGNDGNDTLLGQVVDSLFGQNGNDFLQGGQLLRGGAGNDTLKGLDGNDSMFGDEGTDNLDGGAGFDDLCATAESTANCEAFS